MWWRHVIQVNRPIHTQILPYATGDDEDAPPVSDARQLVNAHDNAELSLFAGAGHRLRHDPRAVAVLIGWLDRMRSVTVHPAAENA